MVIQPWVINMIKAQEITAARRKREREHRYETILKSAEMLFARNGYHQTGMERIAEESEISVGTVYFYFKNKEDLLLNLLDQIGYQLRDVLGRTFRKGNITIEKMEKAGLIFFNEFCLKNPEKVIIIFREAVGQSAYVESRRKLIFDKLIQDIKTALLTMGENLGIEYQSPLSAEIIAVSVMGTYERLAFHYLIWEDRSNDLETAGQDGMTFILGGIRALLGS